MLTVNQRDPTQSVTLRKNYQAAVFKRLRNLKGLIRTTVEKNDALGLGRNAPSGQGGPTQFNIEPAGQFEFSGRDDKVGAFMEWLEGAEQDGILKRERGPRRDVMQDKHFSDQYIRRGYQKGVDDAQRKLSARGVDVDRQSVSEVFNRPFHISKIKQLYTRNFRQLKGVTDAMDQQISRELSEGLAQGLNPRKMASRINDRVDKIGITRARKVARTEVIHTHAEATLNRFQQAGVEKVVGKAEWLTAGDDRVCPICQGLAGEQFTVKEARGRIPAHPNCRCTWVPVVRGTG